MKHYPDTPICTNGHAPIISVKSCKMHLLESKPVLVTSELSKINGVNLNYNLETNGPP